MSKCETCNQEYDNEKQHWDCPHKTFEEVSSTNEGWTHTRAVIGLNEDGTLKSHDVWESPPKIYEEVEKVWEWGHLYSRQAECNLWQTLYGMASSVHKLERKYQELKQLCGTIIATLSIPRNQEVLFKEEHKAEILSIISRWERQYGGIVNEQSKEKSDDSQRREKISKDNWKRFLEASSPKQERKSEG
jgi:hypothetical protein